MRFLYLLNSHVLYKTCSQTRFFQNLQEIQALFPPEHNPFYAGFGNRDTDEISYLKVGIPRGKIFIINPKVLIPNSKKDELATFLISKRCHSP